MKKALLLGILALVLALPIVVIAAPLSDTDTGSVITAVGTDNTLDFTDINGISFLTISTETISTTVTSEYGFSGIGAPADQNTQPGQAVTYTYYITNEGNADDTYALVKTAQNYYDGGNGISSNWAVTIEALGGGVITELPLSEDANGGFKVVVTPSSDPAESPNLSSCEVTVKASTSMTPVGEYTGANAVLYGGTSEVSDTTITIINAARMAMSRTATVDAPVLGDYTGGAHDAVPGAIITYTILATNEGSADASRVVVVDKVPDTYTVAAHIGMTGTARSANVTITAPSYNATDWVAYYTTEATPVKTYDGVGAWTEVTAPASIDAAAKWVGFRKVTVEATDSATFTWGVIIN